MNPSPNVLNIVFALLAIAAVLYAVVKHFGAAKVKAEFEQLKSGDPRKILEQAFKDVAASRSPMPPVTAAQPAQPAASASTPAPVAQPSPAAAAPAAAAPAPAAPPTSASVATAPATQPDKVIFDPSAYPDAGQRAAAAQALAAHLRVMWGNTLTKVVSPRGNEIDVRGDEMLPYTGPTMEDVSAPDTLQLVDGTPNVGEVAFGVSMYLKGNCTKTITGVPGNVTVHLYITDRKAGAYKFYVNGQLVQEITAGVTVQTFPASGPTLTLRIEQPDDCTMLAAIQRA